jgi:hypothetical protein
MGHLYPGGLGASTGDALVTSSGLHLTDGLFVRYVDSATGNDSATGLNREQPLATLAAAVSAASAGDIIVLMDGHAETLTSQQNVATQLIIVGEGSSSGKPTVKLTMNASSAATLYVTADGTEIRNIWFEEHAQANDQSHLNVAAASCKIQGCYFEGDENSNAELLYLGSGCNDTMIRNCTMVSTATSVTDPPENAFRAGAAISDLDIDGLTIDGGTVGWDTGHGYDETAAVTRLRAMNVSLLRGSSARLNASTTGYFQVGTKTGSARVEI